jgi:phospholipase/lecithinase/hemolysin
MSVTTDITTVQADIQKLNTLWTTAQSQYEARKAALAAQVDSYVAAHQSAADQHTLEIKAATALKATLVPAVAAIETGAADLESFMLTMPWYKRLVAFFQRNWRWVVYGVGLIGIVYVFVHVHK